MALKVSSLPTLPRANSNLARLWPLFTTLAMGLLTIIPLHIPGYAALAPAFTLMAVYHWTIYRPDLLPPFGVFLIGLAEDLLSGAPIGVSALLLLLARHIVLKSRRQFVNCSFAFIWAGFALLALCCMGGLWAGNCLLQLAFFDFRTTVFRLVLTVTVFPVASYALGRSQRALIDAAG
jgi:rod shape-determining protein MreD